ncbi:adhesion G protein-coupled receptor A1 [Platysternon megacephalum]|uniref:Adhesion G protein-coupled receptor A1 n=1 Tax=Platysternon megacephalum TaxID=55544 RepID=A0A4D9EGT3_9SAUR|nr:adhesion G protein-coupled receptor A1 [Platysternon megacephalum]
MSQGDQTSSRAALKGHQQEKANVEGPVAHSSLLAPLPLDHTHNQAPLAVSSAPQRRSRPRSSGHVCRAAIYVQEETPKEKQLSCSTWGVSITRLAERHFQQSGSAL